MKRTWCKKDNVPSFPRYIKCVFDKLEKIYGNSLKLKISIASLKLTLVDKQYCERWVTYIGFLRFVEFFCCCFFV